jgi:lipopolysaccharide export system protein LptA
MPIDIPRLRYGFAVAALLSIVSVAGLYFYARIHTTSMAEPPKKIPHGVQQNTRGFSLSKSEGGHTLFTVRAESATQYNEGDRAELKDVKIVVYGRQSNRFDQIYGSDFLYDPQSGDVVSKGVVHMDLQSYDVAVPHADQAPPTELRNPVHLVTRGLAFNQKTGDASTTERVDFSTPQAIGWAVGVHYYAKQSELLLDSDVHITTLTPNPVEISAQRGLMSKQPRQVVLYEAHLVRQDTSVDAAQLSMFLRPDDSIDDIRATGGVDSTTTGATTAHVHAPEGVLYLKGRNNELQTADLTGGTTFDTGGVSAMYGSAERIHMEFGGQNLLQKLHLQGDVKVIEPPKPGGGAGSPPSPPVPAGSTLSGQTTALNANALDLWLVQGNQLQRAETSPNAQITLIPQKSSPAQPALPAAGTLMSSPERTVITAGKFYASFRNNHMSSLIGKPDARIVSFAAGQGNRVSTSRLLEVTFLPNGEMSEATQRDSFQYRETLPNGTERSASAQLAVHSFVTDILTLRGSPRMTEGGMTTTAHVLRMDRKNGNASAENDVKTTYNDVKPQPGGALLASGDPIHITAHTMTAQQASGTAHYAGSARLWQGTNVIEAPTIDFDRNQRTVVALGGSDAGGANSPSGSGRQDWKPVRTLLTQPDKNGKQSPVKVTSSRLNYADFQHRAQFEGNVLVRSIDGTLAADQATVYFLPALAGQTRSSTIGAQAGQVDRMIAEGNVVLQQPQRRATGRQLTYTAAQDEYVLVGGPPSFYDAEHGTVNGSALTFYNRDDKVLVEGAEGSRAVTHTRVSK